MQQVGVKVDAKLAPILRGKFAQELPAWVSAIANIGLRFYKIEIPVFSSDARQSSQKIQKDRLSYVVTTTVVNERGDRYPEYVHEGTYSFKGTSTDYPSTGRIRSGESKANRGQGGIKPNMFAKRAAERTRPEATKFVRNKINMLSKI